LGELAGEFGWQSGGPSWLAPGRAARVSALGGETFGIAGQLSRRVADQLKLRQEIYLAELRLDPLLHAIDTARATRRFEPLPRFPAVERDFSLVLTDGVKFSQVEEAVRSLSIPELRRVEAADLFRGGQVPSGKFSLMIRVVFQSAETTLTDSQIGAFSSQIVAVLEQRLGATLRAS